jgi:3-methyladenine DNA glycosylase AlkD
MMFIVPKPPTTPLATVVMERLQRVYRAAADPHRAAGMRAYMRDQFPFLGLPAPAQATLNREVLAGSARPVEADLRAIALHCWALEEREFQYFGQKLLRRHAKVLSSGFLDTTRTLITTKPWWDTVDELAAHVVGPLVAADPPLARTMDAWAQDGDKWLVRTAILYQNRYREATDAQRLFGYCADQAEHTDFFIRKAIGWALREYAKTDPDAVRTFVARHRGTLSGLSAREALRNIHKETFSARWGGFARTQPAVPPARVAFVGMHRRTRARGLLGRWDHWATDRS